MMEHVDARSVKLISATQDSDDRAGIDQNPHGLVVHQHLHRNQGWASVEGNGRRAGIDQAEDDAFVFVVDAKATLA